MDDRTCGEAMFLAAFGMQLRGARIAFEVGDGGVLLVGDPGGPGVTVTCEQRAADADRPWLFCDGEPLAEADQPTWALTELKGMLTAAPGAAR